jgi:predicted hydrocarbon binding protein
MAGRKLAEVSGRAFLGLIRHVKAKKGPDYLDQILQDAGKAAQQVFSERIRVTAWFPYPSYVDSLCAIDRKLGIGDNSYGRDLGREAAKHDIESVWRVYQALASPERLIRSCEKVWVAYHRNAGRMEAIEWSPESTITRIYEFPQMHPVHCRLMEGWMSAALESIGFQVARMEETMCMSRGDPHHEFFCTWLPEN